jgi:hypothetical protein
MVDLAQCDQVKRLLQPGDGIASWGNEPISDVIEALTGGGPSHWETVIQSVHPEDGRPDVEVFGSTFGGGVDGCYRRPLAVTLAQCKYATAYPLARGYRQILNSPANLQAFYAAVGAATDHIRYDLLGLVREFFPDVVNQGDVTDRMFCSAAGLWLMEQARVVPAGMRNGDITPGRMCLLGLWSTEVALIGHRGVAGFKPCAS